MDRTLLYINILMSFCVVAAQIDGIVIKTTQGWIEGVPNGSVRKFLGIPYAHPPVGDLRWKRPYSASSWSGVRKTQEFASACAQLPNKDVSVSSEDCLYLNVYTPTLDVIDGSSLPVMVWIHGGCWVNGSSSMQMYNGEFLVANNQNIVVVSINYRLGPFGYLGGSFLAKESMNDVDPDFHNTTGNYGLEDQRLALQWVKENIAAFGGNPDKSVFGQSAGSGSIACHMVMEKSWGNFDQAIMESGPIADWTARSFEIAENQFNVFSNDLGCYYANDSDAILSCLRIKSTEQILMAKNGCTTDSGCCWYPVIDSVELKDRPDYLAAAGQVNPVPVMLGTNADEETMFLEVPYDYSATQYVQFVTEMFGDEAEAILKLYPPPTGSQTSWWDLDAIGTDQSFVCPARRTARWFSDSFQSKSTNAQVFLYHWTHVISESLVTDPFAGAYHGVELPFVFDHPEVRLPNITFIFTPSEKQLQDKTVQLWIQFATTANPSIPALGINWTSYQTSTDMSLILDEMIYGVKGLRDQYCDYWDSVYAYN